MKPTTFFNNNPEVDIAYQTTDGIVFYLKNDAENHAKTLDKKNRSIKTLNASDLIEQTNKPKSSSKMNVAELKEILTAAEVEFDKDASKEQLKELVKSLNDKE